MEENTIRVPNLQPEGRWNGKLSQRLFLLLISMEIYIYINYIRSHSICFYISLYISDDAKALNDINDIGHFLFPDRGVMIIIAKISVNSFVLCQEWGPVSWIHLSRVNCLISTANNNNNDSRINHLRLVCLLSICCVLTPRLLSFLIKFSPTWSCVSLPRPTTSSG